LTFEQVNKKRTWRKACSTNKQEVGPMWTMKTGRWLGVLGIATLGVFGISTFSWAGPGDLQGDEHVATVSEMPINVLDSSKAAGCGARGGICFKAGAPTTVATESQAVAGAKPTAQAPRFSRAASIAAAGKGPAPKAQTSLGWTLDVAAQLKKAAVNGNTLFVFFDLGDPNSVKNNENTALFQAPVKAGKALALHMSLTGEDGFRAGHTYRMRIAQLLNGREVVLAEADFTLL
jgi:hypothetical protein